MMRKLFIVALVLAPLLRIRAQQDSVTLALQRGMHWLEHKGTTLSPYTAVFIPYLERRYGVTFRIPVEEIMLKRLKSGDEKVEIPILQALLGPVDKSALTPFDSLQAYQQTMFYAIYHKGKGPVKKYYQLIDSFDLDSMGYGITHTPLSLCWALERNCIRPDRHYQRRYQRQARLLLQLIRLHTHTDDLRIEAMAIASDLLDNRMDDACLHDLLRAQKEDGGWNFWGPGNPKEASHEHTTLLAVWTLLDHTHPLSPRVNWFPR